VPEPPSLVFKDEDMLFVSGLIYDMVRMVWCDLAAGWLIGWICYNEFEFEFWL